MGAVCAGCWVENVANPAIRLLAALGEIAESARERGHDLVLRPGPDGSWMVMLSEANVGYPMTFSTGGLLADALEGLKATLEGG